MRGATRHIVTVLIVAAAVILSTQPAHAKDFALIVPKKATVGVGGGHNIVDLGYIVATSQQLTLTDFNTASMSATMTGSGFTAAIEPLNLSNVAPLSPGQVGGLHQPSLNSLLLPGETLKNPVVTFYQLRLQYPSGTTQTQTLNGSFAIGGSTANFQTTLQYNPSEFNAFVVTEAQRITVPEPSTTLLACASILLAMRRTRAT